MREITTEIIKDTVASLLLSANINLNSDLKQALDLATTREEEANAKKMLEIMVDNYKIAGEKQTPICQDTGMAVVFVEWGSGVCLKEGSIEDAINEGVRESYQKGCFRKSVVLDPLRRINTKDNTPAVVHYKIVPGDRVKIKVTPKGFGSENMSKLQMFNPTTPWQEIEKFIVDVVVDAGANPCPPLIVGVGIGGTMEKAAILAKEALLRDINQANSDPFWAEKEKSLLESINNTGIGSQGVGGSITALFAPIETYPTHIAGLPVAVNLCCHALRHKEACI